MSPIENVSAYLIREKERVGAEITHKILTDLQVDIETLVQEEIDRSTHTFGILVELMGKALIHPTSEIFDEVVSWSSALGEDAANRGEKLDETLQVLPSIRSAFIRYIGDLSIQHDLPLHEVLTINERINYTLDIAINQTVKAHDYYKEKKIQEAYEEATSLSAPIVPIHKGIAILPLIGSIDSYRAAHIHKNVIPRISELHLNTLIIDLSGIQVIDSYVTDHLFKIYNVLRLIGIHVVLTGIRPELAQTAVGIGLDFSRIEAYLNVQQALKRLAIPAV
ncbi:STAS domain-containing protein [Tumebacillus sp. DT12]|uniref:STAS domain-containing protein n=1 Tax=Tumebacillus lacus TaxID=2995335 RepID=A0ABT3X5M8_9BACL|nr:STAS domain-containing protein [Tumebacillus lacus]MCX7571272.1 STAS domain-containing protein [Tumebacillus lacus]